ncbi:DUF397 domain-containing protein [Streptomyces griseoincarnatus]|uniref:DUF397 domain-containing protein n=3 Tax=Streptomyces TaxID=1883 RepID=A0ABP7Y0Y3_9ACTN|nr:MULTISPECIES: DUF397 domain-containing protein [Streptomyces]MQL63210.1 DUF397 domain-containing protein [Streptomyces vinaceus]NUV53050.1 DUF397 domain-containing protein [Streptomyces coelicolor]WPW22199.1 DUF397 domain-containing protein [Streptomyces griseoincarnatus]MBJ6635585.1 DUF397 domain-containing protein [Streptomyces sp. I5]GGP56745.1 DUF397 domain-containing protein [Streptomyces griseoincarnatus]
MTAKSRTELTWFKSSHSTDDGPACVEVAATPDTIHIRDSKHIEGPHLTFTPTQWAAFLPYASGRR